MSWIKRWGQTVDSGSPQGCMYVFNKDIDKIFFMDFMFEVPKQSVGSPVMMSLESVMGTLLL